MIELLNIGMFMHQLDGAKLVIYSFKFHTLFYEEGKQKVPYVFVLVVVFQLVVEMTRQ